MREMGNNEYSIQDLLQREVYVNDQRVGRIVGERHHPNTSRVTSIRLEVEPSVAQTYMRKPSSSPLSPRNSFKASKLTGP